jgi:hypothetical protein
VTNSLFAPTELGFDERFQRWRTSLFCLRDVVLFDEMATTHLGICVGWQLLICSAGGRRCRRSAAIGRLAIAAAFRR